MARPKLPVAGPKRRALTPIVPLAGALARKPLAPISPGLARPSPPAKPVKVKPPKLKLGGSSGRSF
jgi:hypothetical protein